MHFYGREREIATITSALGKEKNFILTGKYGIGKTTLIKKASKKQGERRHFLFSDFSKPPSEVCHDLLNVLNPKSCSKKRVRHTGYKQSRSMIKRELDDEYFGRMEYHLKELKFHKGVLISAGLREGNEGTHYILRKPNENKENWLERIFVRRPPVYTFSVHPRDEAGDRALSELKDRGINLVANALGQSADHVDSFFKMLRAERGAEGKRTYRLIEGEPLKTSYGQDAYTRVFGREKP